MPIPTPRWHSPTAAGEGVVSHLNCGGLWLRIRQKHLKQHMLPHIVLTRTFAGLLDAILLVEQFD
jgi:hypothetical protein